MSHLCINASNLHTGGAIQVATSLLTEFSEGVALPHGLAVLVSSEINENLNEVVVPTTFENYQVVDSHGIFGLRVNQEIFRTGAETVFTLFGPFYSLKRPRRHIVGFAQPWIIYPRNECYMRLPLLQRLKMRVKFWVQTQFFMRADVFVVELEHVKDGLINELGIQPKRIHVIHNCVSALFGNEALWQPVDMLVVDCDLRLGFLGRNYLHKNTSIFPDIVDALDRLHGIKARFYVSFSEAEWQACTPGFRDVCINVGPLSVAQCPLFYKALDAVVFPSLLECFSAAPLEAMAMGVPLFASDRSFIRDICQEFAYYFDPLSPVSAAQEIALVFARLSPDQDRLDAARSHAFGFSNPRERAEKYMALLTQEVEVSEIC